MNEYQPDSLLDLVEGPVPQLKNSELLRAAILAGESMRAVRSSSWLLATHDEHRFHMMTEPWQDLTGYSIDELGSQPWRSFIHPDDLTPEFEEAYARNQPPFVQHILRFVPKDGGELWLWWRCYHQFWMGEGDKRWVIAVDNITNNPVFSSVLKETKRSGFHHHHVSSQ